MKAGYRCLGDVSIIPQNIVLYTGFSAKRRYLVIRHKGAIGIGHAYGLDDAFAHPLVTEKTS